MPVQGLHLITPSAAVATGSGSSATINTNGSVTFSQAATLELRGVFSADYDNYKLVCRFSNNSIATIQGQLLSGSTAATTNYSYQVYDLPGSSVSGSRATSQAAFTISLCLASTKDGWVMDVYGPHLAQPTVGRSNTVMWTSDARIYEAAWSHSTSSSYDGFKLLPSSGSSAGLICVYGMRK